MMPNYKNQNPSWLISLVTVFLLTCSSAGAVDHELAQEWVDKGLEISNTMPNSDEEAGCYRRALEIDPKHASANFNLAYILDFQAMDEWRGKDTAWQDLGKLYQALDHYAAATAYDPSRMSAYQNGIRITQLLIETPTHRPPNLHRFRKNLSVCFESLERADKKIRQTYKDTFQNLISSMENRLAELKDVRPSNQLLSAKKLTQTLKQGFTRGQSPYQGPRVPLMIQFDLDKYEIRPDARPQLRELAIALKNDSLREQQILKAGLLSKVMVRSVPYSPTIRTSTGP